MLSEKKCIFLQQHDFCLFSVRPLTISVILTSDYMINKIHLKKKIVVTDRENNHMTLCQVTHCESSNPNSRGTACTAATAAAIYLGQRSHNGDSPFPG